MARIKTGRNERCWCGSGKKYKRCHADRHLEKQLPFDAIRNMVERQWDHKQCLHPLASPDTCDRIVAAHTLQRSRVLRRIVDAQNHISTFYRTKTSKPHRIGWKEASTFSGFCARHDGATFAPLESGTFTGTQQQCFLIAYRALCHEIYQKRASIRTSKLIREFGDRGFSEAVQREVQYSSRIIDAGARKGLAAFEALKAEMDQHLLAGCYATWSRLVVHFSGELCIVSTGAIAPNRDLNGQALQVLHDPDPSRQQTVLYGVDATEMGGAVVFMWPTRQEAPRRFLASLLTRGNESVPGLLVQFMLLFVENTYFATRWWEALSDAERQHLTMLAHVENAYYTPIKYASHQFVPWEVTAAAIEDLGNSRSGVSGGDAR